MQCTNCHFENLPGSVVCGRCGTSMRLAEAAIDVHPPRAGKVSRIWRRILPLGRIAMAWRELGMAARIRRAGSLLEGTTRERPTLLRLPIPGWSHFYLRQRLRGHLFLWGFLALFVPGILALGTVWGGVLVGLAFSVHASAALDIINQLSPQPGLAQQLLRSVVVSVVLFVLLYMPVHWAITRVCEPLVLEWTMGSVHAGDVVMVNRRSYRSSEPRVGDVVLYDVPAHRYTLDGRNFAQAGIRFDRVLAGPGDQVRWDAGQLSVNGKPSGLRPLNPAMLPDHLEFLVPPGSYLILPTTTPNLNASLTQPVWTQLSCIPREGILGRVLLRTHPLWRMGSL